MDKNKEEPTVNDLCNSFHAFAIERKGEYLLTNENEGVIKRLVLHLYGHSESKLNPKRGIYLCGPVGTGKTTLMELLSKWLVYVKRPSFAFVSCRDIQQEFATNGYKDLLRYTKLSYIHNGRTRGPQNGSITYCFDDFGSEGNATFWGNKVNVMEEVLQDRYREFETHGMITHMTSNLKVNTELMKKKYTDRVADRINGMFNIVELLGDSFRK